LIDVNTIILPLSILVVAACSTGPIEPANLAALRVDPASGFEIDFEGDDYTVADVKKHEGEMVSKYKVWPWDRAWPSDVDGFAAKLKEMDFLDEEFRYEVSKTSATSGTWEFRGTVIHRSGDAEPTFVMVRTMKGKRFLCKGHSDDEAAMRAAIASCRSATVN
jgi:hypothetical protein